MRKIFAAVFGLLFFLCSICSAYAPEGKLFVTMLDIGQGDAFLIETPAQNILIDTGDINTRKQLVEKLKAAGISRIERIILSHAHSDHIGGVSAVLKNFPVDEISDNGFSSASPLYKKYHGADVKFSTLKVGDVIDFGGGVYFEVLSPDPLTVYNNVNDQSIVGRLVFDEFAMLFTGDAGKSVEKTLLKNDLQDIQANILKAAHHGSQTSNSKNFVNTVAPDCILISAALGNRYGHPHKKTLEIFEDCVEAPNIYCTAFNGNVKIISDGFSYEVSPDIESEWVYDYLENEND